MSRRPSTVMISSVPVIFLFMFIMLPLFLFRKAKEFLFLAEIIQQNPFSHIAHTGGTKWAISGATIMLISICTISERENPQGGFCRSFQGVLHSATCPLLFSDPHVSVEIPTLSSFLFASPNSFVSIFQKI